MSKSKILEFLKNNNIDIDYDLLSNYNINCYRQQSACDQFSFDHPNENSNCCDDDQMLPGFQMTIRFWSIIKAFGEYNQKDWRHIYDTNNIIFRLRDMPGSYKCICSHNILQLEFLQHIPTDIVILVGSECINKIDNRFNKQTKVCSICKEGFGKTDKKVDKRKQPFRSGFCSFTCKSIDEKRKQDEQILEKQQKLLLQQKIRQQQREIEQKQEQEQEGDVLKERELKERELKAKRKRFLLYKDSDSFDLVANELGFESIKLYNEIKNPLKELSIYNKKMTNLAPNDNLGLTPEDKEKLADYEVVKNLNSIKAGDHFRYTQERYKEQGRKLCYAVVHSIDYDNQILEVNGFKPAHLDDQKYPNWQIDYTNKYKNYIFYVKTRNNKF